MANILIVESDLAQAGLLASRLYSYGHAVVVAASGPLANTRVGIDYPVEVVILEVKLNGMDGFDTLDLLRRHPELDNPNLPAIFLSEQKDEETLERIRALGNTSFFPKPFVSAQIHNAILQILKKQLPPE